MLKQIRSHDNGLRSFQIHIANEKPERDGGFVGGTHLLPSLQVFEDNNLLEGEVGREGSECKIRGDPTAEIFVVLTEHVDEIVFTK